MKPENPTTECIPSAHRFVQQFSSTRRGARLARLLAVRWLAEWGWPEQGDPSRCAALVVGELAANAVLHGHVQGRDFRLALSLDVAPGDAAAATLRIDVTDARGERTPTYRTPGSTEECGRGLLLIEAVVTRWGCRPHAPSGKTVWAELALPGVVSGRL